MIGEPYIGGAALLATALGYDALLATLRRRDRAFPANDPKANTWWFGYARDLTNLFAAAGFTLAFWLLALPLPRAFLAGIGLSLIAYGADYAIARAIAVRRPEFLLAGLLAPVCVVAVLLREPLARGLAALLAALF